MPAPITDSTGAAAPQWAVIELMGPQPDGSFVTQFINPSSLYRLTLCSEEIGRAAATHGVSAPISQWEMKQLLAPPAPDTEPTRYDQHDEEEDETVVF